MLKSLRKTRKQEEEPEIHDDQNEVLVEEAAYEVTYEPVAEPVVETVTEPNKGIYESSAAAALSREEHTRRHNTYLEANKFLPKLNEVFGDSLPLPMKQALAVLIFKTHDDLASYNPNNHRLLVALEDYFTEDAEDASTE